jgi:phosphoenolpyruvate carboxylase
VSTRERTVQARTSGGAGKQQPRLVRVGIPRSWGGCQTVRTGQNRHSVALSGKDLKATFLVQCFQVVRDVMAVTKGHSDPWRPRVQLLWSLLDQVVGEEEGASVVLLANAAIQWGKHGRQGVASAFPEVDGEVVGPLIRLLTERMRMQNLAEDLGRVELVRMRRGNSANPLRGSIDALARRMDAHAPTGGATHLEGHLVLTLHPTESTRRTILQHVRRLSEVMEGRRDWNDHAHESYEASIRENLRALWRTAAQRAIRPTVRDEIELGIFYVAGSLFDTLPDVQNAVNRALRSRSGARITWQVDSWIGGDRDGHPFVDAEVTRFALSRQRETALSLYRQPLRQLEQVLSATSQVLSQADRCWHWIENTRAAFPEAADDLKGRYADEPLRQMAGLMGAKLDATIRDERRGYANAHAFMQDARQLGMFWDPDPAHWPSDLTRLITQIETFGFHLATLDLRQHSRVHEEAIGEIVGPGYQELTEDGKIAALIDLWAAPLPWLPTTPATRDLQETLQVVADFRRRFGSGSVQRFLVSMAHAASDILEVMALVQVVDPELDLEVVPVIETLQDLVQAATVLDRLYQVPFWRDHVARHFNRQEVMLGYSDSTKDAGVFGASWAIYQAQRHLLQWGEEHHIQLAFFHGRGGALGRGGGPTSLAILAQPPGSLAGPFRITQQGEVLSQKLLLPEVAFRSLELMLTAHVEAELYQGQDLPRDIAALMDRAAAEAVASYRTLIQSAGFWEYFLAVTPIREMTALNWGSRPSWREQFRFEDLRAIPWVFSWTQNRMGIPAWYGAGTGLHYVLERLGVEGARHWVQAWPYFSTLVHNLELALVKTDLHAAQEYQELATKDLVETFWPRIQEEYHLLQDGLTAINASEELLAGQPRLARAIAWRNPQVDALNHLQVQLLKRMRASGDDALLPLMAMTMEGIALGVRNSG